MNPLRIFETHGVIFTGETETQKYGRCPFSGKDDKFYVNTHTWLWDSKTAGVSGNVHTFLQLIAKHCRTKLTTDRVAALAADRQLPVEAFRDWGVGWTGKDYSLPVKTLSGAYTDIRLYRPGGRMISTAGAETGLLGCEQLKMAPAAPVYICEGEWDAIALRWLLRKLGQHGVVVGVPGANVFKQEWASWLSGRTIHTLYDHDAAGELGEILVQKRVGTSTDRLTFVHWPESLPEGFDVRDWVIRRKDPASCWAGLTALFSPRPRKSPGTAGMGDMTVGKAKTNGDAPTPSPTGDTPPPAPPKASRWATRPPTYADVVQTFKKWLFLDNDDAIRVMLATTVSQVFDGPPVWLFLVGPPGSAKTAHLNALTDVPYIYTTSSLTTHALISGANWKGDVDPSLIPRLDGKVLVIKDFTSILAMRDAEKDEIFGILRDAYDGRCKKVFGNGVTRSYEARFTVLAAVTPTIHALSGQQTALGERFLKFSTGDNLNHVDEEAIISRAIDNINSETAMQDEIRDVTTAYILHRLNLTHLKTHQPIIPTDIKRRIVWLAKFGARLRGTVNRDMYRHEVITARPSAEVGSRLGIQLAKLAISLAAVDSRTTVNEDDFRLLKKVILDTIPQRVEDVIRTIMLRCNGNDTYIRTHELSEITRYPITTIVRLLQDMSVLDIVERQGTSYRYMWRPTAYIRSCADRSTLYTTSEERKRPIRPMIKRRTARPKPPA